MRLSEKRKKLRPYFFNTNLQIIFATRHIIFLLLPLLALFLLQACNLSRIPLEDSDGNLIRRLTLQQGRTHTELNLPLLSESRGVLRLSMAHPAEELSLELLNQDNEPIANKTISPAQGLDQGYNVLDYQFKYPLETRKLRISPASAGATAELPDFFGVAFSKEYSGFQVDNYRIALPETMRYRQEIYSPSPGSADSALIYQDLYLDDLFQDFDYTSQIPILELTYEYNIPEGGMPLQFEGDHDHVHADDAHPHPAPPTAKIEFLSDNLEIIAEWELRLRPGRQQVYFYPELLPQEPASIRFVHNSSYGQMRAFRLIGRESSTKVLSELAPLPIDLGSLMEYSSALWRHDDFELFNWSLFPQVLIIDFADYDLQARFLKRLAFFTEKPGFRGRLLSNAELQGRHGWNAHNYHPRDLSRFYNQAEEEGLELNPEELLLRDILLAQNIIVEQNSLYAEGEGQIISVSSDPSQARASRQLFLNHEALHAVFYNFPPLRELSFSLWETLPPDNREYLTHYLSYVGYDKEDNYLMTNEFQAYMLQQDIDDLRWIVQNRMAERITRWSPPLRNFVNRVRVQAGNDLLQTAETLQSHIYQRLGFIAGDLFCLVEDPGE